MNLSLFIGKRYVTASRGKSLVFSIFSILGISIGIMTLIVTLAVMNGVTGEVRDKILSMTAHAKVVGSSGYLDKNTDISSIIKNDPRIIAHAPFIEGQALIGIGQNLKGVVVKGIVPKEEVNVSEALMPIIEDLETLTPKSFNIAIGRQLANILGVDITDKITIIVPKARATAAGVLPRLKRFTISAIFDSGHYLYDTGLVLTNIDDAALLLQRKNTIDGFQLKLDDLFAAQTVVKQLNENLPVSMLSFDWTIQNKAYFDAVKTEKAMMFIILTMILLVAALNIISTLVFVISDKKRDVAVLKTIGVAPATIMQIFMVQGVTLCFVGTLLGIVGGMLIAYQIPNLMDFMESNFGYRLPAELYFISELKPRIAPSLVALIAGSAILISFLASLAPALIASRLQPARALAHE